VSGPGTLTRRRAIWNYRKRAYTVIRSPSSIPHRELQGKRVPVTSSTMRSSSAEFANSTAAARRGTEKARALFFAPGKWMYICCQASGTPIREMFPREIANVTSCTSARIAAYGWSA
jgi:hypothetical protein